nr:EAL domain-containing protein [Solirubrobacterales bacterium]
TGLPNRALFRDRLALSLRRAERQADHACAVLFLDVDRFKIVNDGFTHLIGDQLLVALGRRLADNLRPGDTVARLGGDEFTLLLDGIGSAQDAMQTAERIQEILSRSFVLEGREITVTASIGISLSEGTSAPAEMMRDADIAMYEAKRQGVGRVEVFTPGMHHRALTQLQLETELRGAIAEETLRVFYQPIVRLATNRFVGFEALVRWPNDAPGFGPDEFIPVAEDTGMIGDLGRLVLRRACAQLAAWRSGGLVDDDVTMSVNVSCRQLADRELVSDVVGTLAAFGLPAENLRVEVTESTIMWDPERMRGVLRELGAIGVRPHVDDFGTGYSSLTFLHHFPGETLKIDRSFIGPMLENAGSAEIVRTIMALARNLELSVIAEGVERPEHAAALRELGCELGQGYLWARPQPAEAVEAILADGQTLVPPALAGSPVPSHASR